MDSSTAVIAGAIFGLMGCVAPAFLFERALKVGTKVSIAAGLASVLVSFLVLSGVLLAVYVTADEGFLTFGCSMVASFLLFWAVEALRAWRAAQSSTRS